MPRSAVSGGVSDSVAVRARWLQSCGYAVEELLVPPRFLRVPLFQGCSLPELARVAGIMTQLDEPEGKVLIRQGEPGGDFFVLAEGTADGSKGQPASINARARRLRRRDCASYERATHGDRPHNIAGERAPREERDVADASLDMPLASAPGD